MRFDEMRRPRHGHLSARNRNRISGACIGLTCWLLAPSFLVAVIATILLFAAIVLRTSEAE